MADVSVLLNNASREPKIAKLYKAFFSYQKVAGLNISVHKISRMKKVDGT